MPRQKLERVRVAFLSMESLDDSVRFCRRAPEDAPITCEFSSCFFLDHSHENCMRRSRCCSHASSLLTVPKRELQTLLLFLLLPSSVLPPPLFCPGPPLPHEPTETLALLLGEGNRGREGLRVGYSEPVYSSECGLSCRYGLLISANTTLRGLR